MIFYFSFSVNLTYDYLYVVFRGRSVGYVTVSAKIPRRLKELLDKNGIKPSPIIRRALEEVKKCMLSEIGKKLES